jgi:hypothetical protein
MSNFFRQFPKTKYDFNSDGISRDITDLFRFVKADSALIDDLSTYQFYQVKHGDRPDTVSLDLYGTPDYHWTFFILNDQLKDGLTGWTMNSDEFEKYMADTYSGTVITVAPQIVYGTYGTDIITEFRDSLASRFVIGETVIGSISGATGKVYKKDPQLGQLVIKDVTGVFQIYDSVVGQTSSDFVTAHAVYDYADAPHHFEDANGLVSYNGLYINETASAEGQPAGHAPGNLTEVSNLAYETTINEIKADIRVVRPHLIAEFARVFEQKVNS